MVLTQILLTTSDHPSAMMFKFLTEILRMLPNATYYKRQGYEVMSTLMPALNCKIKSGRLRVRALRFRVTYATYVTYSAAHTAANRGLHSST